MMPLRRPLAVVILVALLGFVPVCYRDWVRKLEKRIPHKFGKRSELFTATEKYAVLTEVQKEETRIGNSPLIEFEFENGTWSPFDIEDTAQMSDYTLACLPSTFGYSQDTGSLLFPPQDYPKCDTLLKDRLPVLEIDKMANTFTIECPDNKTAHYLLNPPNLLSNGHYTYHDLESHWKPEIYTGETDLGESEYVYGSCSDTFTLMHTLPRFNETVSRRAERLMQSIGMKERPLTILLLTVDSFSRRHFYRKMEKTVGVLNKINKKSFSVFDYKLHNVIGGTSVENMVPIFGNRTLREEQDPPFTDLLGSGALWQILKSQGYVTMLGFENCDYQFPAYIGKVLEVDHLVRNFYCAAAKFLRRSTDKEYTEQRCLGAFMSHYYLLNYTQAFSNVYRKSNQFIAVHIDTAHEESGQHAATLDSDLSEFLETYLMSLEDRDVVVLLQGDHGMRYGHWFKDVAAHQELKLPVFFLIVSSRLITRIPHGKETLWKNSSRLTSKLDIRATILGLSMLPYDVEYPVHSDPYLDSAVDLFHEEVSPGRTCEDAQIASWYCSCLTLERIDSTRYQASDSGLGNLIWSVASEALYQLNREVYSNTALRPGVLCKKLTLGKVLNAYGLNLGPRLEQVQVEFSVQESETARFEASAIVGTEQKSPLFRLEKERYELTPVIYNGFQVRTRLIGIERKDKYQGKCEVIARAYSLKAEFCLCEDLDILALNAPGLFI